MPLIDTKTRKRLRVSNIAYLVLWVLNVALIIANGPFWMILLVSVAGGYFALRDRRVVQALGKESVMPAHPDPDVQALIDGKIDITEYRLRKEKRDAV